MITVDIFERSLAEGVMAAGQDSELIVYFAKSDLPYHRPGIYGQEGGVIGAIYKRSFLDEFPVSVHVRKRRNRRPSIPQRIQINAAIQSLARVAGCYPGPDYVGEMK